MGLKLIMLEVEPEYLCVSILPAVATTFIERGHKVSEATLVVKIPGSGCTFPYGFAHFFIFKINMFPE